MKVRNPHRKAAFTLVELLVVIGIIALLISILLPSLNKARESAKSIKCASNLKQIGTAFQLYSISAKGWMIPGKTGVASPLDVWPKVCLNEMNRAWNDPTNPTWGGAGAREGVMRCPSNKFIINDNGSNYYSYFASAAMLGDLTTNPVQKPMRFSQVKNQTKRILIAEAIQGGNAVSGTPDGNGNKVAANWHSRGSNYLFVDGHVERFVDKEFDTPWAIRNAAGSPWGGATPTDFSASTREMWWRWGDRYAAGVRP